MCQTNKFEFMKRKFNKKQCTTINQLCRRLERVEVQQTRIFATLKMMREQGERSSKAFMEAVDNLDEATKTLQNVRSKVESRKTTSI